MAKLGYLGLGIMGGPMARHLIAAGHDVALWSHSADKARQLAAEGGRFCETPADVARHADFLFLCVGDSKMSEQVILGKDGLLEGAKPGVVIADCSTIGPSTSRRIGEAVAAKGGYYLDAPCSGSKAGSESGTLTFMVGGDKDAFEKARPYFEAMGKQLYYCGGPCMGLHAKLSQNMVLGSLLQAFNEAMVLAAKAGVDLEMMLDILNNSAARSVFLSAKGPAVLARNFAPNFSLKWLTKDISLMLESAAELGVPAPLTAITQQMCRGALAKGYGDDDICGSIRFLEEIAGCEVVSPEPMIAVK